MTSENTPGEVNNPEDENTTDAPDLAVDDDGNEQISKDSESAPSEDQPTAPPPASFEVHVSMLFTQAMAMLGQMPDPSTGETNVNKPFAKHYIDTLEMLGEKTKGNLSESESTMLSEALHALRMTYVGAK